MRHNDDVGNWRGLDSATQNPRYSAIAEMLCRFKANGNVLDVGCGEAVLRDWLPQNIVYTGIEPSAMAARLARERASSARIIHTSAEIFDGADAQYDSVVFNEVLYYMANPVGLLQKYAGLLRVDGVIICSIFQKPDLISIKRLWRHWLDRRRPYSNIHCTTVVRKFMTRQAWPILDDRAITIPGCSSKWNIWLARPGSHDSTKAPL